MNHDSDIKLCTNVKLMTLELNMTQLLTDK